METKTTFHGDHSVLSKHLRSPQYNTFALSLQSTLFGSFYSSKFERAVSVNNENEVEKCLNLSRCPFLTLER